jgi:hypothetical protein
VLSPRGLKLAVGNSGVSARTREVDRPLARAERDAHSYARVPARNLPRSASSCFSGVMVRPSQNRSLTSRQRAHVEEQRVRNVSAAFARLEKALDNTTRPAWGPSAPDRLAYLQAKFDRRVSDPASRMLRPSWRRCDAANEGLSKVREPERRDLSGRRDDRRGLLHSHDTGMRPACQRQQPGRRRAPDRVGTPIHTILSGMGPPPNLALASAET